MMMGTLIPLRYGLVKVFDASLGNDSGLMWDVANSRLHSGQIVQDSLN